MVRVHGGGRIGGQVEVRGGREGLQVPASSTYRYYRIHDIAWLLSCRLGVSQRYEYLR
jgi:hypothetical protein